MSILLTTDPGRKTPDGLSLPARADSAIKPVPAAWGRAIPGEELTTPDHVYEASLRLVEAGLSVIPIDAYEGSKAPDSYRLPHPHDRTSGKPRLSWSVFQIRRPNPDELRRWRDLPGDYGLAVLGGAVSGGRYGFGLEVIDIDTADLARPWMEGVERKAPGLVQRLVRVLTPRPGMHIYFRSMRFGVSQKLALAPAEDDFGHPALDSHGKPIRQTLIEVKAEGGYCLIPPSPARCHPSCRLYRYADDSPELTTVPTITPDERNVLFEVARELNRWQEPKPAPRTSHAKNVAGGRPGDDFNARAEWEDVLLPHGWTVAGGCGDETRWCRPGKDGGVSATTNHNGCGLLKVFSSNASPFEADRAYSKFTAHAVLNFDGDFAAAARELGRQGYGRKSLKAGKR